MQYLQKGLYLKIWSLKTLYRIIFNSAAGSKVAESLLELHLELPLLE